MATVTFSSKTARACRSVSKAMDKQNQFYSFFYSSDSVLHQANIQMFIATHGYEGNSLQSAVCMIGSYCLVQMYLSFGS